MKKAEYTGLEVGDVIEAGPLLGGLCPDPMMWKVYSTIEKGKNRQVEFDVYWKDIRIGGLKTYWDNGKVVAGDLK